MLPIIVSFGGDEEMTGRASVNNLKGSGRTITTLGYQQEGSNPQMAIVTINVPVPYLASIEKIIDWGMAPSRSEYIRTTIKEAIRKDIDFMMFVDQLIEAKKPSDLKVPKGYLEANGIKVIRRLE